MRREIAEQLADRLESGDYIQGTQVLKNEIPTRDGAVFKHCCLGVVCEMAVEAGVIPPSVPFGSLGSSHGFGQSGDEIDNALPPVTVVEWVYGRGVDYNPRSGYFPWRVNAPEDVETRFEGIPVSSDGTVGMATLNDSGASFEEIAKLVRETYCATSSEPAAA